MTLTYRFKKELLENGSYVYRPRILVELSGPKSSIITAALIDTGCDTTIIPEGIAKELGLSMKGEKDKIYAFRETNDVIKSTANINFLGKEYRQSIKLSNTPILIVLAKEGLKEDEEDIVLGIDGIFDAFDITFQKSKNRIILKKNVINVFLILFYFFLHLLCKFNKNF